MNDLIKENTWLLHCNGNAVKAETLLEAIQALYEAEK